MPTEFAIVGCHRPIFDPISYSGDQAMTLHNPPIGPQLFNQFRTVKDHLLGMLVESHL